MSVRVQSPIFYEILSSRYFCWTKNKLTFNFKHLPFRYYTCYRQIQHISDSYCYVLRICILELLIECVVLLGEPRSHSVYAAITHLFFMCINARCRFCMYLWINVINFSRLNNKKQSFFNKGNITRSFKVTI